MRATKLFIISFILLNIWSGCKTTQYVPVVMESVKVEYQDKYVRDSIYVRDSVEVKINGDTVWVYKDRYVYVDRQIRDSIFITDSIPVPYPYEVVKYTNKLNWFQQTIIYLAGAVLIIGLGFILIKKIF